MAQLSIIWILSIILAHYKFSDPIESNPSAIIIVMNNEYIMMTSWNGTIFRVTGHLCGEFTSHRWLSHTKASDVELWSFLWFASE